MTTTTNQKKGKTFEQEWVDYLYSQGMWVHYIQPAPDGSQPFDVIAVKDGVVYAFDCKTLKGKRFPLNRIEDNQQTAFESLNKQGVHNTYFVIKTEDNFAHVVPSQRAIHLKMAGVKSIDVTRMEYACIYIKQDND